MKPSNHERRELIEDIFAPEQAPSAVSAEEILRLVQHAREAQQRRRRVSATAGAFLAAAALTATFLPDRSTNSSRTTANIPSPAKPVAPAAPAAPSIVPPAVERVDDEHMLALLDETPAALVSWPDGRRSLLVLVSNPPPRPK
jgi:hypothetical protein